MGAFGLRRRHSGRIPTTCDRSSNSYRCSRWALRPTARIIKAEDPQVPREADMVFVCDVLHHVQDREAWLKKVVSEMKPGARLVLIDFKEGNLPEGPP